MQGRRGRQRKAYPGQGRSSPGAPLPRVPGQDGLSHPLLPNPQQSQGVPWKALQSQGWGQVKPQLPQSLGKGSSGPTAKAFLLRLPGCSSWLRAPASATPQALGFTFNRPRPSNCPALFYRGRDWAGGADAALAQITAVCIQRSR